MSLAEITRQVLELSEEERRAFAAWFCEHQQRLAGNEGDEEWVLTPEQDAEMARREKEIDEHPKLLLPWEDVEADLRHYLHELRHPVQSKS